MEATPESSCLPLDYQFSENCGLNDVGDYVRYTFEKCPPGQCNPNSAELCSPCGGGVTAFTHEGTGRRCGEVLVGLQMALGSLLELGRGLYRVVWYRVGGVWIKGGGVAPHQRIGVGT